MFTADEGYYFGLGAFETIAVEEGKPVFLEEHYQRLLQALQFFELQVDFEKIQQKVQEALGEEPVKIGRKVLKITVSQKNIGRRTTGRDLPQHTQKSAEMKPPR